MDNFCSNTTIHGIYQIRFLKYKISKILFFIAVAISTYMSVSQMSGLITTFLDNPASTSFKIENMNREMAKKIDMTICVCNWISKSKTIEANYTINDIAAILSVLQPVPHFNTSVRPSRKMLDKLGRTKAKTLLEMVKTILKPYLIVTSEKHVNVGNNGDICFDLEPTVEPIYSSAGAVQSIFMLPFFSDDGHEIQESQVPPDGYVQWILYNLYDGAMPFLIPQHNTLRNASVNNVVQTVELSSYKTTENCSKIKNDKHILPNGYVTRLCIQKCIATVLTKQMFNCSIPAFSDLNENVCVLPDLIPGYAEELNFFDHYNSWQREQFKQVTDCIADDRCRQLGVCDTWNIGTQTVVEDRRFHKGKDVIQFVMQFNDNIQIVEIYPLYSWEAMISNIGGQAGLWLGASMISFLHLMYSIIELIYECVINRSTTKPAQSVTMDLNAIKSANQLF